MHPKVKKFGLYILALYLVDRMTYFSVPVFKDFLYYPYNNDLVEINLTNIHYVESIGDIIRIMVPFNPYYLIIWLPIIILNITVMLVYYISCKHTLNTSQRIAQYFSSVFIGFLLSICIYICLSFINNYENDVLNCNPCFLDIFLIIYAPYSPSMICGYLIGQSIFGLLWVLIVERFILKRSRQD